MNNRPPPLEDDDGAVGNQPRERHVDNADGLGDIEGGALFVRLAEFSAFKEKVERDINELQTWHLHEIGVKEQGAGQGWGFLVRFSEWVGGFLKKRSCSFLSLVHVFSVLVSSRGSVATRRHAAVSSTLRLSSSLQRPESSWRISSTRFLGDYPQLGHSSRAFLSSQSTGFDLGVFSWTRSWWSSFLLICSSSA